MKGFPPVIQQGSGGGGCEPMLSSSRAYLLPQPNPGSTLAGPRLPRPVCSQITQGFCQKKKIHVLIQEFWDEPDILHFQEASKQGQCC